MATFMKEVAMISVLFLAQRGEEKGWSGDKWRVGGRWKQRLRRWRWCWMGGILEL